MEKGFYKWFKIFITAALLTAGTLWTLNLVKTVEGKTALMNPTKLTAVEGIVTDQKDYYVNRSDIIYTDCKNSCLSGVRYTKITLDNNPQYYYVNGSTEEDLLGKKVRIYYDKDKKIFPKGQADSFGLFIDNKEVIPVISKRDRDSKSVYVYLMIMIFADITSVAVILLIMWENSVFNNNRKTS